MDLTNADVADILALLDSLPYDELDLQTPRFRLTLRRGPGGWTQSTEVLAAPAPVATGMPGAPGGSGTATEPAPTATNEACGTLAPPIGGWGPQAPAGEVEGADAGADDGAGGAGEADGAGLAADGAGLAADGAGLAADRAGLAADGAGLVADGAGLVAVRAPLPGTFYRAPRPGAAPFVEVGGEVGADTVIGIVETMKLMNSVHAGVAGTVAEFCVANGEFAAHGATLLRIRAGR